MRLGSTYGVVGNDLGPQFLGEELGGQLVGVLHVLIVLGDLGFGVGVRGRGWRRFGPATRLPGLRRGFLPQILAFQGWMRDFLLKT